MCRRAIEQAGKGECQRVLTLFKGLKGCECCMCVSLRHVLKHCYCLNLERWKLESPTLTSRSPGTQTRNPEDKENESPGPVVYSRQQPYNLPLLSHSSIRKCRHYGYFCGPNLISFVLVFQKSVFEYEKHKRGHVISV